MVAGRHHVLYIIREWQYGQLVSEPEAAGSSSDSWPGGSARDPRICQAALRLWTKAAHFFLKKKRKWHPFAVTFLFRSQNPFFVSFYMQGGDAGNLTPRLSVCIDE